MPYKDPLKQREFQRQWLRRNRSDFLQGKVCLKCGSGHRLEVDHVDPAQKVSHRIWSWAPERRVAELTKCQVLCRVCHLEKSKGDFLRWSVARSF